MRENLRTMLALVFLAAPMATARADARGYSLIAAWGAGGSGPGEFREPMGVGLDAQGNVYVADSRNRRVQKLSPEGRFLAEFGGPDAFKKPVDVAAGAEGTLYVCDYEADQVQAFSQDGKRLYSWGEPGEGNGQFRSPAGIAVGESGDVYVADFYNHRIQVFDPKGRWLKSIGKKGRGKGEFAYPTDLDFDGSGNLLVADAFRGQGVWMRMRGDPSPMAREMDVVAVPSVLVYGAAPKLALMGVFPYLDKRLAVKSTGGVRRTSGLGDIMTVGRYELLARSSPGQTARGAVFAGLKWPSGKNTESDALGVLPPSVQLGSGSYDPIFGTVWTSQWLALQIDADVSYRRNTKANDFKFGDSLEQNVSLQYRVWPVRLEAEGLPSYLYGVLEANNVYQAKNETGGVTDGDSGGYQLFLTPGLQWVARRTVFELAAQLPAVQSLHGITLKTDYRLIGSFRFWL